MADFWKPNRFHYPDPLGDLYRKVNLPKIDAKPIRVGPLKIEPVPGQIRSGGKLKDMFDPDFPPMQIKRSVPSPRPRPIVPERIQDMRPDDLFPPRPQPPRSPQAGSLAWIGGNL